MSRNIKNKSLIKDIAPIQSKYSFYKKYFLNKYTLGLFLILVWMIFLDSNSFLVIHDLNQDIDRYQKQVEYYRQEYEKNNGFYQKLMNNKNEREKYARENYFMKKQNEEIFILVVDSVQTKQTNKN